MLKLITIPPDVQLQDPIAGKNGAFVSFRQFIRDVLLADQHFVANYDAIRSAAKIDAACAAHITPGSQLSLDVGDWEKLSKVAKTPTAGHYPQVAVSLIQLMPFFDAIIGATDQA
jgi:hypothetical protein